MSSLRTRQTSRMSLSEVPRPFTILLADDDEEDRALAHDALQDSRLANEMKCVVDGQDLLDYLRHQGRWTEEDAPRPGIILLDLNMPRMDGREALAEIKADAALRRIPIVVLTTSKDEADVLSAYDLGVSSFIIKPVTFGGLVDVMKTWTHYWFQIVELPNGATHGHADH
jgi:CheY-like chemotaxis protein